MCSHNSFFALRVIRILKPIFTIGRNSPGNDLDDMKRGTLELLICPACLPWENALRLHEADSAGEEIHGGILRCGACGRTYRIDDGVARLIPSAWEHAGGQNRRYEEPDLLSSYLWSHYSDLCEDPESSGAYGQWAAQITPAPGVFLDIGCATGRFSFELARKCESVIGIDWSERFIATARRLLLDRKITYSVREEGRIRAERTIVLPEAWDSAGIDFLVADAQCLPFRAGTFAGSASLNIVDKVPQPLLHILEASRVGRARGYQFLLSDPFSWSEDVSPPANWLGGTTEGRFAGAGLENIARLLSDNTDARSPGMTVRSRGSVWWKIRNHRNHYELIRSEYIKAER